MRRKKVEKVCPKCKVKKNIEECFYIGVNKRDGCRSISSYCIDCWKSFDKEPKRKEERSVTMNKHYLKKTGKTKEERQQNLIDRQLNAKRNRCKVFYKTCLVTNKIHTLRTDRKKYFISNEGFNIHNATTKKERLRLYHALRNNSKIVRQCVQCNKEYNIIKDDNFTLLCCSIGCSTNYTKVMSNKYSNERHKRYGEARQRAKKVGALVHRVERLKIFERDKFKCWICGNKTDKNSIGKCNDNSPTLDHVQPLIHGGSHTATNLKTACFRCNSVRQHRDTFNYQLTI
jgi:hypothetical protein